MIKTEKCKNEFNKGRSEYIVILTIFYFTAIRTEKQALIARIFRKNENDNYR